MMMPILVEITYEDGTVENFIQLKSGEKMTLLEKYMLLRKQSRKFN
jgi:hypothetical protein